MDRKSQLLMVQADHLSGELLGSAVEKIMACGARNVQIIPSITKKNRPGTLVIIDADEEREPALAALLLTELKISGYHRIATTHVFQQVTFTPREFLLKREGKQAALTCTMKLIGDPSAPVFAGIEHDDLLRVQSAAEKELQVSVSLYDLKAMIEPGLRKDGDIILEL